jgi:hypothetical protein
MTDRARSALIEQERRKTRGRQFATAAGHPEWENACRSCGCQLPLERDLCESCQLKHDFPKLFQT